MLHGVRGIHIDRKGAAVDHDALVKPTDLGRFAGSDEPPIAFHANPDQQPVPPGSVIGEQQYRSRRIQHRLIKAAEAV